MTPSAIRSARKRFGLSYREFATELGFTSKHAHITVFRWERGDRTPSEQTVVLIKQLLKAAG